MSPVNIIRALIGAAALVILVGAGLVWSAGDADAARYRVGAHCVDLIDLPVPLRLVECPDRATIPPAPKLRSTGPGELGKDHSPRTLPDFVAPQPKEAGPAEPECDEPTEPAAPDTTTADTTTESE